jgi:hypothetical protein
MPLASFSSLVSIGAVGIHGKHLARSEPTPYGLSGPDSSALNRLRAEALGDFAIGIDAGVLASREQTRPNE